MKTVKVPGKNNEHRVRVYALSTCAWCKLTKKFLNGQSVEYEYVDVDLCDEKDHEEIARDIKRRGGSLSYPTLIIDDNILITGFREDKIREALRI
jgi:glutaredoxin-like protein NrdH